MLTGKISQYKTMNTKQSIRKELLKKRNTLTEEDCQNYSKMIEKQLLSSEQYRNAQILLIYAAYQKEVSTYGIIKHALCDGKKVFCPKVLRPEVMEFYQIFSLDDIIAGYKNIPEPKIIETPYDNINQQRSLMILPLVGFDSYKNRLGYGGGFYDRYLQQLSGMKSIGLGFECQKYEPGIPTETTDIKPNFIITETNIY